jgi:hypothetical protein
MSFRDSEREPEGDELRYAEESSLRDSSPSDFSDTSAPSVSAGMKAHKPRLDGATTPESKTVEGKSRRGSRRKGRDFAPAVNGYRGDYRSYLGYAGSDYRDTDIGTGESDAQIDWAAALWRYRYAMLLPVLVGIAGAGAYFTTQPSVYRSTARLVVESETSWAPDARDENATSAVPPSELLLMQL